MDSNNFIKTFIMRTLKINDTEILVVEVPKGATGFDTTNYNELFFYLSPPIYNKKFTKLPPGNWQILGRASEITEEQAKGIVEIKEWDRSFAIYTDYVKGGQIIKGDGFKSEIIGYDTALESWKSFCTAKNIKDSDLILIKKI